MTLAQTMQAAAPAASARTGTGRVWFWPPQAAARRLARRSKTARATTAGLPLRCGERVVLLEHAPAGCLIGATAAAVYAQDQAEPGRPWCRIGWEEMIRTGWDERRGALTLIGAGPSGVWRKELAVDRHSALVELARERIAATLLASAVVRDSDRVVAVVMARRQPGSGRVDWVTLLSQDGATNTQSILARAAVVIADLQAQTGIPAATPSLARDAPHRPG
jgi:hypothetical protein